MAYRKTELILAAERGRQGAIIAAVIDIISKTGVEAGTNDISERAGVAKGLIYNYWADKTELMAAVTAHVLERDRKLLQEHAQLEPALLAWVKQCASAPRAAAYFGNVPSYRDGMKKELSAKLRATGVASSAMMVAAIYGAVVEAAQTVTSRTERDLVAILFRTMGQRVSA